MIGEQIGNFRVVSMLGQGGMGAVYLAEQVSIKTKVAVKVLLPHISADKEHVQRFFNEAIAVSRIKHSGIAKIFDVGFLPTGQAYLVMEFLDGENLASRIRRSGRLSIASLADIGRQIANVLEATHQAGITHRDLKPDNVFIVADAELDSGERVKVLDFGIAKLSGASLTGTVGGSMGTPAYMAPEQWHNARTVDWRADAYSLGCLAFEMAAGRPPFVVQSIAEACTKHLTEIPVGLRQLVPDTPVVLEALVARLVEKDSARRPASMKEITQAFAQIGRDQPGALAVTLGVDEAQPAHAANAAGRVVAPRVNSPPQPMPVSTTLSIAPAERMAGGNPPRKLPIALLGAAGLALAAVLVFVLFGRPGDNATRGAVAEIGSATSDAASAIAATGPVAPLPDANVAPTVISSPPEPLTAQPAVAIDAAMPSEPDASISPARVATPEPAKRRSPPAQAAPSPPPLPTTPPSAGDDCDEVSCVLNNNEGRCCAKFKKKAGGGAVAKPASGGSDLPEALDRGMVSDGLSKVTAQVMACGPNFPGITGQVKVGVKVSPDGYVTSVTIKNAPDGGTALANCVASAVQQATFAKTQSGGAFAMPYQF